MLIKKPFKKGIGRSIAPYYKAAGGGGGGYTGPGDLQSGASAWWGLRAYSNATTTASAVDVFGLSTTTTFTFVTKADGTLELSAGGAAAFLAANVGNMLVTKLYDQTGNGHHMIGSGGSGPAFTINGLGSLSVITFVSSKVLTATGFAVAQPYTVAGAFKTTTSANVQALLTDSTGAQFLLNTTPALRLKSNTSLDGGTTTSGTWFALQGQGNGASSVVSVNGSDTSGNAGTNGYSAGHSITIGGDDFSENFVGAFGEEGIWPSAFGSSAMSSNIRTFWGF